jgi:glutamyl-tRNA synthetase/glutamyl-Q tRNA(Asp) synthetase
MDAIVGPCADEVATGNGDLPIRDRDGNWTYGFAVVVDDLRQEIDLVIRGRDLLAATPAQIRLGRLLGRDAAATFAHHPLIRRPDGSKLSKADGDTSVRELRVAGRTAPELIGEAAAAVGLIDAPRPIEAAEVAGLFGGSGG